VFVLMYVCMRAWMYKRKSLKNLEAEGVADGAEDGGEEEQRGPGAGGGARGAGPGERGHEGVERGEECALEGGQPPCLHAGEGLPAARGVGELLAQPVGEGREDDGGLFPGKAEGDGDQAGGNEDAGEQGRIGLISREYDPLLFTTELGRHQRRPSWACMILL
jgi:hypothetical protein